MTASKSRRGPVPALGDEMFTLLSWQWNVTAGWRLAAGRAPVPAVIAPLRGWLPLIAVDQDHAAAADLSRPLLAAPAPGLGLVIIDGWHRIARAFGDGVPELPVVSLTEAEEAQVRIRGGETP